MIAYAVIYKNYFKEDMKMASGQIRMTPDTMRERAGEYRTEADNVPVSYTHLTLPTN